MAVEEIRRTKLIYHIGKTSAEKGKTHTTGGGGGGTGGGGGGGGGGRGAATRIIAMSLCGHIIMTY